MPVVHNLQEAKDFFAQTDTRNCLCLLPTVNTLADMDDATSNGLMGATEATCYADAMKFYIRASDSKSNLLTAIQNLLTSMRCPPYINPDWDEAKEFAEAVIKDAKSRSACPH